MKIDIQKEKIIIYLYQYSFSFNNKDNLNKEIKNLFIKLIRKYSLNLFGFNKVMIYENKIYGSIIEIENIAVDNFCPEIIDLKISVFNDVVFYFEFDEDYFISCYDNITLKNNKYYLEIKEKADIYKYIEYGKIIIKK